ncbi:MAG: hypothetical protein HKN26_04110, partial [Acidimicrobiales bacterium]|nr:hypothetical protein [Acidimicrobiales bacterium]
MSVRSYGAAASEHPLATHAIGEVVGDVIEQVGVEPDLALLFVTAAHVGVIEDMVGVVREVLRPDTLVGVTAVTVIGGGREMEDVPAVALWAGNPGRCEAVRFESITTDDGAVVTGMPHAAADG